MLSDAILLGKGALRFTGGGATEHNPAWHSSRVQPMYPQAGRARLGVCIVYSLSDWYIDRCFGRFESYQTVGLYQPKEET